MSTVAPLGLFTKRKENAHGGELENVLRMTTYYSRERFVIFPAPEFRFIYKFPQRLRTAYARCSEGIKKKIFFFFSLLSERDYAVAFAYAYGYCFLWNLIFRVYKCSSTDAEIKIY
jgi:hypothetical protein